jgi:hypothetical protein
MLHLDYYSAPGFDGCSLDDYNELFDELNSYDTLETLKITTDFINSIPSNVLKFKNLKTLIADGSRFWDLTMEQVPTCVEVLDLTRQSNLSPECLRGMERLVNLKELRIDDVFNIIGGEEYYGKYYQKSRDEHDNEPVEHRIKRIPGLRIIFETGTLPIRRYSEIPRKKVEENLRKNKFLSEVDFRLEKYDDGFVEIVIN